MSTNNSINDTCYPWEDYVETKVFFSISVNPHLLTFLSLQLDSRVGLVILVICIVTLLADLVFFGLIFTDAQLRHQVI